MVGTVAIAALVLKLIVAATTYGTNDISYWHFFTEGIRQAGPVGIYGLHWVHSPYNHPPLIGYFLEVVNGAEHLGLPWKFTIRAFASLADVASAFLVFELVRHRRGLLDATAAGVVIAASPVLFVISGFHGNTDPIFTMCTLLSVYLLADRQRPGLAGAAIAVALSIKIVPIVAGPALLVFAVRQGRRTVLRFGGGFAAVFIPVWAPALLLELGPIVRNVLGYQGSPVSQWGLVQFGHWAGDPSWVGWLDGPGRVLLLAISAGVPALAVWRHPDAVAEAVGLTLVGVLLLSPAFGTQYLVWAAAASLLLGSRIGAAFNVLAGILLVVVYTRWNGGLPWDVGRASILTAGESVFGEVVWAVLLVGSWQGLRSIWMRPRMGLATGRSPRLGAGADELPSLPPTVATGVAATS